MKWRSIRTKLIIFMLIATIVPIVTTMIVFYLYTSQSMKERALEDTRNLLYQGQRNLTAVLDEINRSSLNVYTDAEMYRELQSGLPEFQTDSRVFASMSYIKSSVPNVHQVYLYASLGRKAMIVTNAAGARRMNDVDVFSDVEKYVGEEGSTSLQSTHMSHTYGNSSLQPQQPSEWVFTLHRRIERIPSTDTLGYLSIDVKQSILNDIVGQLYDPKEETLYVVDDDGYVIYADDKQLFGKELQASWYEEMLAKRSGESGHFEKNGALYVYERVQTTIAGWTIIKRIPTIYLIREAKQAVNINLLILALSLIVIVTATIIVSFKITAPIKKLVHYMNQVQAGNLNIPIKPAGNDEIGLIVNRFSSMMDTINNLILREYKLELANKTNQLRALQAQINPHFLNNTIQIIGTLALELGVPRIYALLSALARLMRYSMDNDTKMITLRDELVHLNAYMELQKERYENCFEYHVNINESLLDAEMPKMILQPVIENYFKHGMDKSAGDGQLLLTAGLREDDWFEVVLENNGIGIPEKRLAQLHQELANLSHSKELHGGGLSADLLKKTTVSTNGDESDVNDAMKQEQDRAETRIGLHNVLSRMLMIYGDGAKLEVENILPRGVRVTLVMKKITKTVETERKKDEGINR